MLKNILYKISRQTTYQTVILFKTTNASSKFLPLMLAGAINFMST